MQCPTRTVSRPHRACAPDANRLIERSREKERSRKRKRGGGESVSSLGVARCASFSGFAADAARIPSIPLLTGFRSCFALERRIREHLGRTWECNGTRWALGEFDECVNRNCTRCDIPKRPADCYSKRCSLSFDGELAPTNLWHLGLGELPPVRASASSSERDRAPESRNKRARGDRRAERGRETSLVAGAVQQRAV